MNSVIRLTQVIGTIFLGLVLIVPVASGQSAPENLVLSFTNLAPLDEAVEGHYEGWAILDGSPVSTGKFNVNEAGEPVALGGGAVIDEFDAGQDITTASNIVITLEPPGDDDDVPAAIKPLAAPVQDCQANLRLNVPGRETLETTTTGAFILATPSDNPDVPENDDMGIWFLTMPGPEPGLQNLPDIGPDWTYEGWVVDTSDPGSPMPYSTGTFGQAQGADSDEAGCNGGGPPFPGQDYVAAQCPPALTLDTGDFVTVITIEPVPDNVSAPFQLKPLAGPIPTDALGQNNEIENQAAETFPTGSAALYCETSPTVSASWSQLKGSFRD